MFRSYFLSYLAPLTLLIAMPLPATGGEYQSDITYTRETKKYHQQKSSIKTVSLTQYIEAVPDNDLNLLDSSLISKTASIRFDYSSISTYGDTVEEEGSASSLNYTHMLPESRLWVNLILGSGKIHDSAIGDPTINKQVSHFHESGIGVGFFISQNSLLSFNHLEHSRLRQSHQITGHVMQDHTSINDNYLKSKTIFLSRSDSAFELEISAGTKTLRNNNTTYVRNEVYQFTTNFYYNNNNSFGMAYTRVSGEQSESKGNKYRFNVGLTDPSGFKLQFAYEKFIRANELGEYEYYSFSGGIKF